MRTRSTPRLDGELERVNKGLKKLEESMEARDIKRIRIHHRTTMSDLSWVKGTIRGAVEKEGWSEEIAGELYGSVCMRVLVVTQRAERMLEEADVRAKQEWSERFIASPKKVQVLAAQAHHYLTPEDWSVEAAEKFTVNLRVLRDKAKKLRSTVLIEA